MRAGRTCAIPALLAALVGAGCRSGVGEELREEGRLGAVRILAAGSARAGLVFLFSGADGWTRGLEQAAHSLAGAGALVVGVDLAAYLSGLRASDDGCHYVVAELEDLSHRLQREHGFEDYRSPILSGVGAGATLAYAALAQSPAATLAGAVSVDPADALATRVPLCAGAPFRPDPDAGFRYGPAPALPGFWWLTSRRPPPAELAALAEAAPGPPAPGDSPERRLEQLVRSELEREAPAEAGLADLPLVEIPAAGSAGQLAVIYSGDGGWRDIDKQIGGVLARAGTPVVGVDSLRYFWHEKSPGEVASDLARILRHYGARFGARQALLIGYSFGAGILPFAVNHLPADARAGIAQISLLGLASRAPFQISVAGWLGGAKDQGLPVLPELRRLDLGLVQCFYGEQEEDTLCTAPELAGAQRIRTSGGHHFDGDYAALARHILDGAARRARARAGGRPDL